MNMRTLRRMLMLFLPRDITSDLQGILCDADLKSLRDFSAYDVLKSSVGTKLDTNVTKLVKINECDVLDNVMTQDDDDVTLVNNAELITGCADNFRPPTESTSLNRSPKNLSQVIKSATPTAAPNLVHMRSRGLLGEWVKYNLNYFYLFIIPLFGNSPTGQTRQLIFAHDGSNDADSPKDPSF